ncbi:hypothetical protein SO802_006294 [Lithocarpus litseifolius]|uniref:O-methyltransferase C-terminal domain-containing protein n=1 Tax=Lithocarpus litseifolius TaxID=425828 RepID=A0AAW2DL94_9ROSI
MALFFASDLVLHALSEEECVKVLKKCREANSNKGKEGKVIITDIVIDEKKDEHEITSTKLFFDMLMMVVVTGRERHEKEWEKLFLETSFSHYKIKPLFGLSVSPWHFLESWFRGDKVTPFESAHGMGFWDFADQNPDFNDSFIKTMASDSGMMNLVVKDCKLVFEGLDTLVDVGGGTGTCARIISEAFPHLKCTVLELPQVVANLPDNSNLNFVGGDMFQSIPSADAILLKLVLHALSDEECVKVLKKCREAISNKGKGGKVIIIDIVIDEKKDEHEITSTKLYFDMLMMVMVTGRERHEKEWEKLFLEAGFSHYKIKPLFGLRSLIEVYP